MKTNFKKLGSLAVAVGMMSALSVTAFASESIPASKLVKAEVSNSQTVPMTKVTENDIRINTNGKAGIADKDITISTDGNSALLATTKALEGFEVKNLDDGSVQLINKKTGETISVVMKTEKISGTVDTSSTAKTEGIMKAVRLEKQ